MSSLLKAAVLILVLIILAAGTSCSEGVEDTEPTKALVHMRLIDGDPDLCPASFTTTEHLQQAGTAADDDCVVHEEIPGSFVQLLCSIPDIPECLGDIIIRRTDENEYTTRVAIACAGMSSVCYYRSNVYFDKHIHRICDRGYLYQDGKMEMETVCN